MKVIHSTRLAVIVVLAAVLLPGRATFAQMPGGSPAGVDLTLLKLMEKVAAFSAKAEARVLDKEQNELVTTPMTFSKLDDKVRVEVDLSQIKGKSVTPADAARMKELGLDRVVSITRPDKKQMYIIYPGLRSYVSMALSKEDAEAATKPRLEATVLGKETLDGHSCVKNKVVVTDPSGQKREVLVWNATDLKEFPIQIQTTENGTAVVMRYSDVKFARPDAKLFDPPAGFAKFADLQEMMQSRALKTENPKAGK